MYSPLEVFVCIPPCGNIEKDCGVFSGFLFTRMEGVAPTAFTQIKVTRFLSHPTKAT